MLAPCKNGKNVRLAINSLMSFIFLGFLTPLRLLHPPVFRGIRAVCGGRSPLIRGFEVSWRT